MRKHGIQQVLCTTVFLVSYSYAMDDIWVYQLLVPSGPF